MAKPSTVAKNQLNTTNQAASGAAGRANDIYSGLEPIYSQMATNPTASPVYNSDVTASRQALGGATAGITGQGNLEAARTRNSAGYAPALDEGMRKAGQQQSQIASALPGAIQQEGLSGLGSLYGTNVSQENSLYGLGPASVKNYTDASQNPFLNALGGAAGKSIGGLI